MVPYRTWSDPAVDNDGRIFPPPPTEQQSGESLWVAGLLNRSSGSLEPVEAKSESASEHGSVEVSETAQPRDSWLDPIQELPSAPTKKSGWLAGLVREESPESLLKGEAWLGDLVRESPTSAATSSWLAGLVKSESRPAMNDIARLLFGESAQAPTLSPSEPFPAPPIPRVETTREDVETTRETEQVEPLVPRLSEVKEAPKREETSLKPPTLAQTPPSPGLIPPAPAKISPPPPEIDRALLVKAPPAAPIPPTTKAAPAPTLPRPKGRWKSVSSRDRVSFYNSLTTMFDAGVPLFAIFEFLARQGESPEIVTVCRRIGQNLVSGVPIHAAVAQEPQLFDAKAVRLIEVGYRSGELPIILAKLAEDEEQVWKLKSMLKSQLAYPCCIALIALAAVMVLPPLVLTGLLKQIVAMTAQPPLLTQWLLKFSELISSPWTLSIFALLAVTSVVAWRSPKGQIMRDNLEPTLWFLPGLGPLWRNLIGMRFLRVFNLTYESGLPATLGMELATGATGSQLAYRVHPLMKRTLVEGGTLTEAFQAGGFLPPIAIEAINAGESAGSIPVMLESATDILSSEVESRVDAVAKLIEPLVLACLGVFVGVFVLGCLLPIVELTETL